MIDCIENLLLILSLINLRLLFFVKLDEHFHLLRLAIFALQTLYVLVVLESLLFVICSPLVKG